MYIECKDKDMHTHRQDTYTQTHRCTDRHRHRDRYIQTSDREGVFQNNEREQVNKHNNIITTLYTYKLVIEL